MTSPEPAPDSEAAPQPAVDAVTEGFPPPGGDEDALARAAAALHLGVIQRHSEPVPAALWEKLRADADRFSRGGAPAADAREAATGAVARRDVAGAEVDPMPPVRTGLRAGASAAPRVPSWLAWTALAAASLALGVFVGSGRWSRGGAPVPALARAELMRSAPDLIRAVWEPGGGAAYAHATGDLVWSTAGQRGFLRLKNLPVNEPGRRQYQLWIVDPLRDAQFPVDGGVFDIRAGATEALVPINAKLPILAPTAFVITEEIAGGVVKSRAPQPVLVAKVL